MSNPKEYYVSYLLRLRQVQSDNRLTWVVSLQNTATGEKHCFATIEALVDFLWTELGGEETGPDPGRPARYVTR
ncbi:MAG: hypothetical protein AB1801_28275 [Chloroflexota bacterium]